MISDKVIRTIAIEEMPQAMNFLLNLIRFESLSGKEQEAIRYLESEFSPLVDRVERVGFSSHFRDDPEYSSPLDHLEYSDRYNLRCVWNDKAAGPTVILNAHVDVVPPSKGQASPFAPYVRNGTLYGRGACDDKGQIACLWMLMRILNRLGEVPNLRLVIHLVVEEENGGNGTLGMVRAGDMANAAIVMEPTSGRIATSVRGAVWFRITTHGISGHSGQAGHGVNALDLAIDARQQIVGFHQNLLKESGGIPLFDSFQNPMPLTFGKFHAGTWPSMVPDLAVLEGVMGFLPNRNRDQVMAGIRSLLQKEGTQALSKGVEIEFMYRHDGHVTDPQGPLASSLALGIRHSGGSPEIAAFPASCDSWYYNNLLHIPTVVFGAGHLVHAHSAEEQIRMDEIERVSIQLVHFAQLFSTFSS